MSSDTTHRLHFTHKGRSTPERRPRSRESSGPVLAGFDETEVRQLLLHLEGNSRAASDTGGTRRTINGGRHAG